MRCSILVTCLTTYYLNKMSCFRKMKQCQFTFLHSREFILHKIKKIQKHSPKEEWILPAQNNGKTRQITAETGLKYKKIYTKLKKALAIDWAEKIPSGKDFYLKTTQTEKKCFLLSVLYRGIKFLFIMSMSKTNIRST